MSYSTKISLHILVLIGLSWATAWVYLVHGNLLASILLLFFVGGEIAWLYYDLHQTQRKLTFFFEAVQNEDTTLRFPEAASGLLGYLHREMNRVNELIRATKVKQVQQEQFFELAMNQAATGLLTIDDDGFIPFANQAARQLLCYNQLSHAKQLKQIDEQLYEIISNIREGEKSTCSFHHKKNHTSQLIFKATSFQTQWTKLRLLTFHDVKSELDEKESEAWVKLIRVLSHEMINTIAPISSLAETLSTSFEALPLNEQGIVLENQLANKTIKALNVIQRRGEGLISFVEKYRQLTRLPSPQKQDFSLQETMSQLRILLSSQISQSNVKMEIHIKPNDLRILADREQIIQALLNIILNAIEALERHEEGKIDVEAYEGEEGDIHIRVSDNGPGISSEQIPEVFIPFFTTKENGSGIGLSLSRQILHLHGGSIDVHILPEGKTTFWIRGLEKSASIPAQNSTVN